MRLRAAGALGTRPQTPARGGGRPCAALHGTPIVADRSGKDRALTQVFDLSAGKDIPWLTPRSARASSRHTLLLFCWASAVGTGLSTEFLFQPFIWRNYDLAAIGAGWATIWRERLIVAWTLALVLAAVPQLRLGWRMRATVHLAAVVVGAFLGEALLAWMTPPDQRESAVALLGRVLRWSLVGGAVAAILQVWRSGVDLAATAEDSRIRAASLRRSAASLELDMLRRQIEPHFLFNTLATIRRLCETDPDQSRFLMGRLFEFLSATLTEGEARPSQLGDEIALVSAYLDVCASRMGGRLAVKIDVEPGLEDVEFPPLVLATLAENAMKHGIFPQNGGVIEVNARREGGVAEVALIDDGVGFSGEGGGGLGLANIVERLRLLYGARGGLRLQANTPKGVIARLYIPLAPA